MDNVNLLSTIYYLQLLNTYSASPCAMLWHNSEAAVMSRIIIISWRDMAPLLRHHQLCQYLYHHHPTARHFALNYTHSAHLFEQLFIDFCSWYTWYVMQPPCSGYSEIWSADLCPQMAVGVSRPMICVSLMMMEKLSWRRIETVWLISGHG